MSRINSNIPSLIARANLERTNRELGVRLERLSTGLQINRGADDPAGLIISERLRSNIEGINQGIKNADRASSVIATTEASLAEINDLLNSIKALTVEAANTGANSDEERRANQLQIDSAIDSITRISNTASFGGLRLLDGSLDYVLSGISGSAISKAQILSARFDANSTDIQVDVEVLTSAQVGALYMRADYSGSNATMTGRLLSATQLQVAGPRGVEVISLPISASLDTLISNVNQLTSTTGVTAERLNASDINSGVVFKSEDYGSSAFVSVERLRQPNDPSENYFHTYEFASNGEWPGTSSFSWSTFLSDGTLTESNRDEGQNVSALVNGMLGNGDGLKLAVNSSSLGMDLLLNEDMATRPGESTTFYITGGGAMYQLGPEVTALQQANIGIQSVAAARLGGTLLSDGMFFLSSLRSGQTHSISSSNNRNDFTGASKILETAIDETSILRGRLGAFERNVLNPNVRSLQAAFENLSASESQIRDADFAFETSQLTRAQILASSGTTVLGLANQQSQQILQLLG